jgi:hypothetical protein
MVPSITCQQGVLFPSIIVFTGQRFAATMTSTVMPRFAKNATHLADLAEFVDQIAPCVTIQTVLSAISLTKKAAPQRKR